MKTQTTSKLVTGISMDLVDTTIVQPVTKKFIAKENFLVNVEENSRVKIYQIDKYFEKFYLEKIEDISIGTKITSWKLDKASMKGQFGISDERIIYELGGESRVETSLFQIYSLLEKQPCGESGFLATTACTDGTTCCANNIFYVRDIKGELQVVVAVFKGFWYIDMCSLDNLGGWSENNLFFTSEFLKN